MTTISVYYSPENAVVAHIIQNGRHRIYKRLSRPSIDRLNSLVWDYATSGAQLHPFLAAGLIGWSITIKRGKQP